MKPTTLAALIAPIFGATKSLADRERIATNLNLHVNTTIDHPSLAAQQMTAQTFVNAYNAWNIEAIMEYRTPDCQQQVLPFSMGKPAKNNTEYRSYFESIMPLFSNFTVKVHNEFHNAEARTSYMHASSRAETAIGTYANEYAVVLSFTKDGTKITKIEEFVDSAYSAQFFAKLAISASKAEMQECVFAEV
jgi:ketosteroid isomerase-like protein